MHAPGWYLVAYDVTEPRRLQSVHRYLRKRGLPVQKSVFVLHGTEAELKATLDELTEIIHVRQDDVRAYPIEHPSQVWLSGVSAVEGPLLRPPATGGRPAPRAEPEPRRAGIGGLIARLWRKEHER